MWLIRRFSPLTIRLTPFNCCSELWLGEVVAGGRGGEEGGVVERDLR